MTHVILTKSDYDRLRAIVESANAVYNTAQVVRGIGNSLLQSDIAMARLKTALDAAQGIEVKPHVDSERVSTTKKRRR